MSEPYSWSSHIARHAAMIADWGKPVQVDAAMALRLIGSAGVGLKPDDVIAFRYRDRDAAENYARSNAEHNGIRCLGIADTEDGVIGVLDLRTQREDLA